MKKKTLYATAVALAFSLSPVAVVFANDDDASLIEEKISDTDNNVNPEDTANPEDTGDPDSPGDPEDTVNPDSPADPEDTVNPDSPADPEDTGDPESPVDPEDTNKEGETGTVERDIDAEKAAFAEAIKTGYAEVGEYKVELIKDNIYHMDESTEEDPGGTIYEDGTMNNPSSIYFVVGENEVLIVDGGNPIDREKEASKWLDAKIILETLTDNKEVSGILTHTHYDHVGLFADADLLENIDLKALYISENDYLDDSESFQFALSQFEPIADKVVTYDPTDEDFVFSVDGVEYHATNFYAHTYGSVAIYSTEKEVVFTGDSMGSGFVWLFWQTTDNPIGDLDAALANLQGIVRSMASPSLLAGHRWQQFWDENAQKPGEMTIQYLNDMRQVISGLKDGSTVTSDYASYANGIELSSNGCKAKIDTFQEFVDIYRANLYNFEETHIYVDDRAYTLDINSVNNNAAASFVIYADGALSDEEAKALLAELGIDKIIEDSASKAVVVAPSNGESFTAADADIFLDVLDSVFYVADNVKLIGIGQGATFVNQYLTQKDWMLAGIMTYGGEAGDTAAKYTVPAYVSNSSAAVTNQYVESNHAEKTSTDGTLTTYVNPESRFEIVVSNSAEETLAEAFANAWTTVLSKFGRLGNIAVEGASVGTWYSTPLSVERDFQLYDSVDAITNMNRYVVTESLNDNDQLSLWYEYIPDEALDAEDGTIPVVFLMHGNTNDPRMQYDTSGWATVASNENIILICPEWQGHTFQGYTYEAMTTDTNQTPDSDFITLVKLILEKYPQIDASRVYISGLSAGSRNTTNNALVNTKYFAAAAGHSGPFMVSGDYAAALDTAVAANKEQYDIPIIYFTGDKDEYMTWDTLDYNMGLSVLQRFEELNDMDITQVEDLSEEFLAVYGIPWEEFNEVENEGLCTIVGGSVTNDKGVTISMNRIYGWGHWNYPADAQLQWDFMKQYARDPETGETILLSEKNETPETPSDNTVKPETPSDKNETPETPKDETPEAPKDETPEAPKDETTGTTTTTPAASTTTTASTSDAVNTAVNNNTFAWMGTMMTSLGAAAITLLKKKED